MSILHTPHHGSGNVTYPHGCSGHYSVMVRYTSSYRCHTADRPTGGQESGPIQLPCKRAACSNYVSVSHTNLRLTTRPQSFQLRLARPSLQPPCRLFYHIYRRIAGLRCSYHVRADEVYCCRRRCLPTPMRIPIHVNMPSQRALDHYQHHMQPSMSTGSSST